MNNILNERVTKLIKADLLEYGKYLLFFLVLGFAIPVLLNMIFGTSVIIIGVGSVNIEIDNFGTINIEGLLNFVSFAFFTFFMFIGGIITGAYLPTYVRWGVARKEYFTGTIVAAVIVSLAFAPVVLLLNTIINLLVSSGSSLYNFFHIGGGEIPVLIGQFLAYVALFLLGYCIPLVWQRFGWHVGMAFIFLLVAFIIISGLYGLNTIVGFNVFNLTTTSDYLFELEWSFTEAFGYFGIMGITMIVVLGISAFLLTKDVPVKVS